MPIMTSIGWEVVREMNYFPERNYLRVFGSVFFTQLEPYVLTLAQQLVHRA